MNADPAVFAVELRAVIEDAIANQPRSLQAAIGPSELGGACVRCLVLKLAGVREERRDPAWLPYIGTAVHASLAAAFTAHEATQARLGRPGRYLAETRVDVGGGISGSCDLFDTRTGTVVDWKGLAIDTPIPVPDGWATIASIRSGDKVFAANGEICTVIGKSPLSQRDCYRITFDDSSSIVSDNVHEWPFVDRRNRTTVLPTEYAARHVFDDAKRPQRHLRISTTAPLVLPDADLPVPPYTLGAWIGDGFSRSGHIGKPDDELFDHIASEGFDIGPRIGKQAIARNVRGLIPLLRAAMLYRNKHIPGIYLRASISQRLALLQGLMDTDGSWNRIRNQAVFVTVNKALAYDVAELVASLGWKPRVWELTKHGFGLTVTAYDVTFVPHDANPFRMSRKADLVRITGSTKSRRRIVRSIEPTLSVTTQCIEVDSADHTYLCGTAMIPTHNCVGAATLRNAKANGPTGVYRTQVHLYGRGHARAGHDVATVGVYYLPRNEPSLANGYWWCEPYDEQIAVAALDRAAMFTAAIAVLGAEQVIADCPPHCGDYSCARYDPFPPVRPGRGLTPTTTRLLNIH